MLQKNIFFRIAGHAVMLTLLLHYLIDLTGRMPKLLPIHKELHHFNNLSYRYYTVWNMVLQMCYQTLALVCDLTLVLGLKSVVPAGLMTFRLKVFHELLFPVSSGVSIFWPIYFYDRELILPVVTELILSKVASYVCHGLVIVYVLWELVFLPDEPKRKDLSIKSLLTYVGVYMVVVLWTRFVDLGVWMYEFFQYLEGPQLFVIFWVPVLVPVSAFYLQYHIRSAIIKLVGGKPKVV